MSDTGIQLFDSKARLLPVDQIEAQISDDATRARFVKVRDAHAESEHIDAALTTKQEELKSLVGELANVEAYLAKFWPNGMTHQQLWVENFGRR